MIITEKHGSLPAIPEDSDRFAEWRMEEVGSINAADCGRYRIQNGILGNAKFPYAEVSGALVKSKTDMDLGHAAFSMEGNNISHGNELMIS
jgi:hypothetical protein